MHQRRQVQANNIASKQSSGYGPIGRAKGSKSTKKHKASGKREGSGRKMARHPAHDSALA